MYSKLQDICVLINEKIRINEEINENMINLSNYVSTENMLPNKGGIVDAEKLPPTNSINKFSKNDVLISNIRPYFKKIWLSKCNGGCSGDILVFRSKKDINPLFLYYVLSNDKFFDYVTLTSKGTKMPRGDKSAIMNYDVPNFPLEIQKQIANKLKFLDEKIYINKKINQNLVNTQKIEKHI
ncbi:MAG: restriction endonuclease subunit S [Methanobrevibacter sp.]|nr:restriction endonuclease subunit S [Candidatus Methanovirga australis]